MFVYVHETLEFNKKYQVWMIANLVSSMSVLFSVSLSSDFYTRH